ncbi:hypothetical protein K438DRAFT_1804526 [Mycena galopus ATCC 62051]|nr:hypothetical protein K438DRAFT_1804526 [Mycena galopus ATCC 62051]
MPGKTVRFSDDVVSPPTPSPTFSSTSLPSSYGPFTPPNAFNPYMPLNMAGVAASGLHHTLAYTGAKPLLCFDVTLPPDNVKPATNNMAPTILCEYATKQEFSSLVLVHPRLGRWRITVQPAEGKVVLVRDVLSAIYTSLRQAASAADFASLPPAAQVEVTAAFNRRWARMPTPQTKAIEQKKGLKRVDFLGSMVTFAGLLKSQSGQNCWELLLS